MGHQIPNVYRSLKWLSQEYENRKRFFEQMSDLKPDEAREKVCMLAGNIQAELDILMTKLESGDLDGAVPMEVK